MGSIMYHWSLYVIKSSDGSVLKQLSASAPGTNIQDSIYFDVNNGIYIAMSYQYFWTFVKISDFNTPTVAYLYQL